MSLQVLDLDSLRFPEKNNVQLRVESWSNAARTVQLRGFSKDGLISKDHATNSDRSRGTEAEQVSGIPISLQVSPSAAPVRHGELYVRLSLEMAGFSVGRLSAGYLTDGKTINWPPGVFEDFLDGPGLLRFIAGTNPAAGVEHSETVPTNAQWKLKMFRASLVASADTANREAHLRVTDGSGDIFYLPAGLTQTASQTRIYQWSPIGAQVDGTVGNERSRVLPDELILDQAWTVGTTVSGFQAADDWGAKASVRCFNRWSAQLANTGWSKIACASRTPRM